MPLEYIDFSYYRPLDVILKSFFGENPLSIHSNKQQGVFYMHFPMDRTVHSTAFDGPIVDHWLEWKIAQIETASTEQNR